MGFWQNFSLKMNLLAKIQKYTLLFKVILTNFKKINILKVGKKVILFQFMWKKECKENKDLSTNKMKEIFWLNRNIIFVQINRNGKNRRTILNMCVISWKIPI